MERSKWAQEQSDSVKENPEYIEDHLMIGVIEQLYIRMGTLGISECDLAALTGYTAIAIDNMLNHGWDMPLKTLVTLSKALGLKVEPIKLVPLAINENLHKSNG